MGRAGQSGQKRAEEVVVFGPAGPSAVPSGLTCVCALILLRSALLWFGLLAAVCTSALLRRLRPTARCSDLPHHCHATVSSEPALFSPSSLSRRVSRAQPSALLSSPVSAPTLVPALARVCLPTRLRVCPAKAPMASADQSVPPTALHPTNTTQAAANNDGANSNSNLNRSAQQQAIHQAIHAQQQKSASQHTRARPASRAIRLAQRRHRPVRLADPLFSSALFSSRAPRCLSLCVCCCVLSVLRQCTAAERCLCLLTWWLRVAALSPAPARSSFLPHASAPHLSTSSRRDRHCPSQPSTPSPHTRLSSRRSTTSQPHSSPSSRPSKPLLTSL